MNSDLVTDGIHRKRMGRCELDITGPVAFGTHLCRFLGVAQIKDGLHAYTPPGGRSYLIDVRLREIGGFLADVHDSSRLLIETKAADHSQLVYKSPELNYVHLYRQNKVYR